MAALNTPWSIRNAFGIYAPGPWTQEALCAQADPDVFFPDRGQSPIQAKLICRSCPVQVECADYAINSPTPLHGVWGGMGEHERRKIRRSEGIRDQVVEEHGTEAGAKRHERRGEVPCFACRHAAAEAGRRRRQERP